ncbi:MAG: membrane protein insertase YidC [Verrucomicrobiia bacterium]
MDRTGIIVVSLCVVLLGLWFVTEQKYASQMAQSHPATNSLVTAQTETATAASNAVSTAPTATTTAAAASLFSPDTNTPEQTVVLTNAHARYTFTSRGGGLKSVELLDYPETVSARWKTAATTNGVATLNTRAAVPVLAILGGASVMGDGNFTLTKTDDGVRAEKSLPDGLRIVKEFHIGADYLVNVTVRLENMSDKSLSLPAQDWVVGTATPMGPDDNGYNVGMMWYNGVKDEQISLSYFSTNTAVLIFFPRTPKTEYREGASNVVWAAAHNQFFTLLAMPTAPAAEVIARPVYLPPFPGVEQMPGAPPPEGIQTALVYPAQTLGTNQVIERQIVLFAGPKEYRMLARIGEKFKNHADLVMNYGGVWGFFAKALLVGMNWLHDVTRLGYGWVIVLFTVILKVLFWPLMAKSTRSMKKMQALAPELKALQAKYKDDPQKLTQKQWEMYRKHKVSPMSGCLPMLIQMPVFLGFYTMIRSAIELRGAHFLWVADLSKPDTLFMIPGLTVIPFISTPQGLPFNLLPLLMGGAMLWQSHLQPPSPGMDQSQAKIMRYLPLIFLLFLYNYSSGLTLYWTVNNLLTIAQTKLTKMNQAPAVPGAASVLTPPPKKKK